MPITFDRAKSDASVRLPGRADLPSDAAADFDFETALVRQDTRPHPKTGEPYPEPRFQAIGRIRRRTVMLVYTPTGEDLRVISLRPADRKERQLWLASRPCPTTTTPPN